MARSVIKKGWLLIGLTVGVLFITFGYYKLRQANKQMIESKTAHEAIATVKEKNHVVFDETNHSYVNGYNDRIEVQPGEEQWRVYYVIDDFNHLAEPLRDHVIQKEDQRTSELGMRFVANSKKWYDVIEVGNKLEVTYRAFRDGEVEVISVTNPKFPSLH
jgi:hypothetical protein